MKRTSDYTALGASVGVHVVLLVALALAKFTLMDNTPPVTVETVFSDEREQQEFTQDLDINTEISETMSVVSGATVSSAAAGGSSAPAVNQTKIETSESLNEPEIQVNVAQVSMPGANMLGEDLGESEIKGETAAIVDGYGTAMSRLTQELIRLMRSDKVHVVWLFDESGSMKDDQEEIRQQFHKVYEELKIAQTQDSELRKRGGETLETTILSFGEKMNTLTPKPTSNIPEIQKAIASIPIDESGIENTFQAIEAVCEKFGPLAFKSGRKLAIVLITDESGDDYQRVEETVTKTKRFKAPVYIMGREAIFGYPYARFRWTDPKFGLPFWIQMRRGPETVDPEALQYDGLHERWDAFSSGFGPYALVRVARESGGIYFMLPGEEENLAGAGAHLERRFEFLAMKEYQPLLQARREYEKERTQSKFRSTIWEVISVLNPHQDEQLKIREHWYPLEPDNFRPEGMANASKALRAFGLLNEAIKRLESIQPLRAKEDSMRWRAAYDLAYAQCLAYRVRLFQFMLAVDSHLKEMPKLKDPKNNRWDAKRRKELLEPDEKQVKVTKVDIDELNKQLTLAKEQFEYVKQQHPGTPWAQRAQHELNSGFGFHFVDTFRDPKYDDQRANIKVPNL